MKKLVVLFLFACLSISSNATNLFSFDQKNFEYKLKNGWLEGNFIQKYPNGDIMVQGKFENNQRIGTWNFYSINGQLVEKRLYFNNYSYAKMKNGEKQFIEFDKNNVWTIVNVNNIRFKKRLFKYVPIDGNKFINFEKLQETVTNNSELEIFKDSRFINRTKNIDLESIIAIKVKEDYFYDNKTENLFSRPIGIGFVNEVNETVAWIYYPDWKDVFQKIKCIWKNDHTGLYNLNDVFTQRAYKSTLYKTSNNKVLESKSTIKEELELLHNEHLFIIAKN